MTLQLHGMSSPNVRKVGIMLEETGQAYTLRHVAVFQGAQTSEAFLAMNPVGKVPVLVDEEGGVTVFESGAILIYLAERYGPAFLPRDGAGRYDILQWLMVQMAGVGPMFGQHNHFRLLGDQADPYAAGRYKAQTGRFYRILDDRLAARDWIAGGAYSIADMAVYPWALYLEQHGFAPTQHPHLLRWRDRIGAREAVVRSWARFAQDFGSTDNDTRVNATKEDLDRFFWRDDSMPDADYSRVTR